MRDPDWPSVADPEDRRSECPICESDQGHQPDCLLYLPLCACGRVAQRDGQPCNKCQQQTRRGAA